MLTYLLLTRGRDASNSKIGRHHVRLQGGRATKGAISPFGGRPLTEAPPGCHARIRGSPHLFGPPVLSHRGPWGEVVVG